MESSVYRSLNVVEKVTCSAMALQYLALNLKPDENWGPLFQKIWELPACKYWDEWTYEFAEYIPMFTLEFSDYASSKFENLSEEDYLKLKSLYQKLPKTWNDALYCFKEMILELAHDENDDSHAAKKACCQMLSYLAASALSTEMPRVV